MQFTCPCLNITLDVVVENGNLGDSGVKLETIQQLYGEEVAGDQFFLLADRGEIAEIILQGENGIIEKLPICVRQRSVDNKWEVRRCVLCGADAYALRSNMNGGQVLVNTKLILRDPAVDDELRKSAEISPVFHVILPKTLKILAENSDVDSNTGRDVNGCFNSSSTTMLSRGILQSVQTCISRYLNREQEAMDERIRRFIDREQEDFEAKKAEAKVQKSILLRFLARSGDGSSTGTDSGIGAGLDDDFDGALPLSPLSMTSGEISPRLTRTVPLNIDVGKMTPKFVDMTYSGMDENETMSDMLRPKAMSNPADMTGWKGKRHCGNNGISATLTSHAEENHGIFTFDEQEIGGDCRDENMSGEEEENRTDDINIGEDYKNYYPSPPIQASYVKKGSAGSSDCASQKFGTSLPVCIPVPRPMTKNAIQHLDSANEDLEFADTVEEKPKDVGASMHALASSMQGADDPQRLFGERPQQRRRWKTGEDQQRARQRLNSLHHSSAISFIKEQKDY